MMCLQQKMEFLAMKTETLKYYQTIRPLPIQIQIPVIHQMDIIHLLTFLTILHLHHVL